MGKYNLVIKNRKVATLMMDQYQSMSQPRSMEQEPREPQRLSSASMCDLVWRNGVAYCEFHSPETADFRVEASIVLDTLQRMIKTQ